MTDEPTTAPRHRGRPPAPPAMPELTLSSLPRFVRERSLEIAAQRPWRLVVHLALSICFVVAGSMGGHLLLIGMGASSLFFMALWFFASPLLSYAFDRVEHALAWRPRRR